SGDAKRRRTVTHHAMIVGMRGAHPSGLPRASARRTAAWAAFSAWMAIAGAACADRPKDPLQLDGNRLTVDNRTSTDWSNVEIWLNTYYRVTVPSIPSMARFVAPLDTFVAAYGQRFDFLRPQAR